MYNDVNKMISHDDMSLGDVVESDVCCMLSTYVSDSSTCAITTVLAESRRQCKCPTQRHCVTTTPACNRCIDTTVASSFMQVIPEPGMLRAVNG